MSFSTFYWTIICSFTHFFVNFLQSRKTSFVDFRAIWVDLLLSSLRWSNVVGHLWGYDLVIIRQVFLQIIQYILISGQIEQCCRQALFASTTRATNSMDILSDVRRRIVINHMGNVLYVNTSRNDICAD